MLPGFDFFNGNLTASFLIPFSMVAGAMRSPLLRWLCVLLVSCSALVGCFFMQTDDSVLEMLPGGRGRQDISLMQHMGLVNRIFITVSIETGQNPEKIADQQKLLLDSTNKLGQALDHQASLSSVIYRFSKSDQARLLTELDGMLPQLFTEDDAHRLEVELSSENIKQKLEKTFLLLNSPAGIGLKKQIVRDPLNLSVLLLEKLGRLRADFSMQFTDGFFVSPDGRHSLIIAESRRPLTDSTVAEEVDVQLKQIMAQTLAPGITASLIGTLPHTLANSRTIMSDLRLLLPLASVALLLLLLFSLRSLRGFLVYLIPFLAAPPAILLTWLIHGTLSGMALGFGIVLLGIGIDFGVHLYLGLISEKGSRQEILTRMMKPICYATATSCGVFVVLLFSEVPVHRQMASLALIGLLLAVFLARLLIPSIIGNDRSVRSRPRGFVLAKVQRSQPVWLLWIWLGFIGVGVFAWPGLTYNGDLRHLDVQNQSVQEAEKAFREIWGQQGEQIFVFSTGQTEEEALNRNSQVARWLNIHGVEKYQSVAPIIPGPSVRNANMDRWHLFWKEHLSQIKMNFDRSAEELGMRPTGFVSFWESLSRDRKTVLPELLLSGPLGPMLSSMLHSKDNINLAMTIVSDKSVEGIHNLEQAVPGVRVVDPAGWRKEVETRLRSDILRLSLMAGLVVLLLVWLQFRSFIKALAVLAPVATALSAMVIYCALSGASLNMMHMIMAIMVIGLSVDYGIFMVYGHSGEGLSSSFRGVSICAASSLLGFGVLAFASHPALHSLGVTVLVGIGLSWPAALFISPLLMERFASDGGEK